jgi:hypothetical protein
MLACDHKHGPSSRKQQTTNPWYQPQRLHSTFLTMTSSSPSGPSSTVSPSWSLLAYLPRGRLYFCHHAPHGLLLLLLLISGVHPNPGPRSSSQTFIKHSDAPSQQHPVSSSSQTVLKRAHVSSRTSIPDLMSIRFRPFASHAHSGPSSVPCHPRIPSLMSLVFSRSLPPCLTPSRSSSFCRASSPVRIPSLMSLVLNPGSPPVLLSSPLRVLPSNPPPGSNSSQIRAPGIALSSHSSRLPPACTFLQFNCDGLRSTLVELQDFLSNYAVEIACLQETKLSSKSKSPSFPNYNVLRQDRPAGGGGGLIILVHHSVQFTSFDDLSSPRMMLSSRFRLSPLTSMAPPSMFLIFTFPLPPLVLHTTNLIFLLSLASLTISGYL